MPSYKSNVGKYSFDELEGTKRALNDQTVVCQGVGKNTFWKYTVLFVSLSNYYRTQRTLIKSAKESDIKTPFNK